MIAPTPRLLIFYGLIIPALTLLPLIAGIGYLPTLGGCAFFGFVAILDCTPALARIRSLRVGLPPLVRMTKGREGAIHLDVETTRETKTALRLGLPLPAQISSPYESLSLVVPGKGAITDAAWTCTARVRGRFSIDACYVETRSILGLWTCRKRLAASCEIRVYPDLAEEGRQLSALFFNRSSFGLHARRQQGRGREFERLRDYVPGDGYDEISWKATAKRHHPVTRLFQIERTQEVYVCIDTSRLSGRLWHGQAAPRQDNPGAPSAGGFDTHLDRFIGASLVLGLAARKQGDLFGMAAFDESVRSFLRAAGSKSHYGACRESLVNLDARLVSPDYEELFTFIRTRLRRRCLIMILTSLDDPLLAETFSHAMEIVCRNHLVYVVMLKPEGARPLFSNQDVSSTDAVYEELSGHEVWRSLREVDSRLRSRGVHLALVDKERLCVDLVSQYMNVKQRQLL